MNYDESPNIEDHRNKRENNEKIDNSLIIEGLNKISRDEFNESFFGKKTTNKLFTSNYRSEEFKDALIDFDRILRDSECFKSIKISVSPKSNNNNYSNPEKDSCDVKIELEESKNNAELSALATDNCYRFNQTLAYHNLLGIPSKISFNSTFSTDSSIHLALNAKYAYNGSIENVALKTINDNSNPYFSSKQLIFDTIHKKYGKKYTTQLRNGSNYANYIFPFETISKIGVFGELTKSRNTLDDAVFPTKGFSLSSCLNLSLNQFSPSHELIALVMKYNSQFRYAKSWKDFTFLHQIHNGLVTTTANRLQVFDQIFLNNSHNIYEVMPNASFISNPSRLDLYLTSSFDISHPLIPSSSSSSSLSSLINLRNFPKISILKNFDFHKFFQDNLRLHLRSNLAILLSPPDRSQYLASIGCGFTFKLMNNLRFEVNYMKIIDSNISQAFLQEGLVFAMKSYL